MAWIIYVVMKCYGVSLHCIARHTHKADSPLKINWTACLMHYILYHILCDILKQVQNSCRNGKKTLLITYAGGHGYEDGGGQCMLINDTVKACLPIETRLKNLAT